MRELPLGWRRIKLSEAYWFQEGPGVRNWQFKKSGIKLLNVGNITKDNTLDLDKTDRHLDLEEVQKKYKHFLVDAGDLVIASSGVSFDEDGFLRTRGAFVNEEHLPLCMNTSTIRFKSQDGISDLQYFRYWLQSNEFRVQISKFVTGSAQLNFGPSHLKKMSISLPPLPEQQRIAAILDKADALRAKRRAALAKLDTLLQATFIDMFGDPVTNPMGWEVKAFNDVCESRLGKMLDAKQQTSQYIHSYLRNANVQWDRFELDDLSEMDFDEKDKETFRLEEGDLLICEGGEVGRTAIWRGELTDCYYQKALHRARANPKLATPEFMLYFMWLMAINHGLEDHTTSATIAHLTGVKLKRLPVPLPPLERQKQFTKRYNKTHALRLKILQSQDYLNNLFHALQQRAFKGEL